MGDRDTPRITINDEVPFRLASLQRLTVSRAELEALVQAAYDQHGIVAEPSYDTEAALSAAVDQALEVVR